MSAYWITPENKIIPVITSHIDEVFNNPLIFGLSYEYLISVYQKYEEVLRTEGQARQEIIGELVKRGFIRIRRYKKIGQEYWSVNVKEINEASMETIRQFFRLIDEKDIEIPIVINSFTLTMEIRLCSL